MNLDRLRKQLDEVTDHAILYHGFTDYMRDYEIVIYATADPRTGIPPVHLRYLFKYCVEAIVISAVSAESWRQSLDDRLINYDTGRDMNGYVWGVKWQDNYPGATIVMDSLRASNWRESIGIEFHEVRFETNGHNITLVFSELDVVELHDGYSPFTVHRDAQ